MRLVLLSVLTKNDIGDIILEKEKFWCGTLVTQRKGLNRLHGWNSVKRTENPKSDTFKEQCLFFNM